MEPEYHATAKPQFVALFDVLGFRARLSTESLDRIIDSYNGLRSTTVQAARIPVFSPSSARIDVLQTVFFSDTMFMWCDDSWEAVQSLLASSAVLIAEALRIDVPLRGGIAYGRCLMDAISNTYVGQPIVDAYLTEQSQKWAGAALHASVVNHATLGPSILQTSDIIAYPIPTKWRAPKLRYAIHWCPYGNLAVASLNRLIAGAAKRDARRKLKATSRYVESTCAGYWSAK